MKLITLEGMINMESVRVKIDNIYIEVDYRTELLGVIMWISNYHEKYKQLFNKCGNEFYVNDILKHFSKYKNHKLIKKFEALVEKHSFNYDAPLDLFLQLDSKLNTNKLTDYCYLDRLQGDEKIFDFINELNTFSNEIDFYEFYNSHRTLYAKWINGMSYAFKKYNLSNYFFKYYGYNLNKKLIVNLIPFMTNGGFYCSNDNEVYDCFPVFEGMQAETLFDSTNHEKITLFNPFHEFSHAYINPITDKLKILTKDTNFFDDIRESMKRQAYPYDTHIINEHIVRALEIRYIINVYGDYKWAQELIEDEKENSFIYIEPIVNSLCQYERQRNIYKRIDDFYPIIIKKIKEYKNTKLA